MTFSRSLSTKEMAKYVVCHFVWDWRGVAFPPLPLPKDFQALCPSYELAVAKEAAKDYELPELPQVIFYVGLLNEAERLGSCTGERFECWSRPSLSFVRAPLKRGGGYIGTGFSKPDSGRRQHQRRVQGLACRKRAQRWSQRVRAQPMRGRPPLPTMTNRAEGVTADFELLEMVQATFYGMLLNEAVELGVVRGFMAEGLKSALEGLRWSSFEFWMSCVDHELREAQLQRWAIAVEVHDPLDSQEESSGSNSPPAPSSDEE
ncbi:hypothetical protein Cgig2_014916 [Carnegiea gigantea]|uniref:Uncharacterized protein n=1 Tax=Carnegiea gigantea TaxID=171969 RepID=A0A9Q1GIC4_9CARY|nr:hypothetical protein Cgig2_014916 [Carnegiea gigantea]